jgi:RNA polymerase sigma factor (sigma-70 family)
MSTDAELLRRYAEGGSEAAFAELVERHVDLVYGAAVRQAWGDVTLAEDLTQGVFTAMARKAGTLSRHPVLSGWLYNYVRYLAANHHRADQRRQRREQASIKMNTSDSSDETDPLWEEVKPVLDDAMHGLDDKDRNAVVLRFYENQSLREVGAALGLSENAARMRVGRALTKLRNLLAQRGVSSSTSGLATALGVGASFSAPAGMAATVATKALAATACVTTTTTTTLATIMSMTKIKIGAAAIIVTAGLGVTALQESRVRQLRKENAELQTKVTAQSPLRAEIERLKGAIASSDSDKEHRKSELEIAGLRGRLAMATARLHELDTPPADTAKPKPKAEPEPAAEAPKMNARMNALMRASMHTAMERQTLGKLPLLTERLALSPEQEKAARAILQRGFDEGLAMATNMLSGNLTPDGIRQKAEEFHRQGKGNIFDPMAEIQALLTPEQKVAHEEYKQEEKVSKARLIANGELLEMQTPLALTQEQQDQVYDALYHQRMEPKRNPTPPSSISPTSSMQWNLDQKVRALEGVLSPVQLEKYREIQEQKMKMMTSLMPVLKQ